MTRPLLMALIALSFSACTGDGPVEGQLEARLFAPASLANEARSVVVYVLDGERVDHSPLACSALLAREGDPFSSDFYLLRQESVDVDATSTGVTIDGIPVGASRVFFVEIYDQPGGLGNRIALGCTAGVKVEASTSATVDVTITSSS
jgi:hypothetical protein